MLLINTGLVVVTTTLGPCDPKDFDSLMMQPLSDCAVASKRWGFWSFQLSLGVSMLQCLQQVVVFGSTTRKPMGYSVVYRAARMHHNSHDDKMMISTVHDVLWFCDSCARVVTLHLSAMPWMSPAFSVGVTLVHSQHLRVCNYCQFDVLCFTPKRSNSS